jgi:hypothetical protein
MNTKLEELREKLRKLQAKYDVIPHINDATYASNKDGGQAKRHEKADLLIQITKIIKQIGEEELKLQN